VSAPRVNLTKCKQYSQSSYSLCESYLHQRILRHDEFCSWVLTALWAEVACKLYLLA